MPRDLMNARAAGSRFLILSCSCMKLAGGSTMREVSRRGDSRACFSENAGERLSLAMKLPCTWQARMRISSMTGVFDASDNSNASSTARTMLGRLGRGSSSQIWLFIANACVRSCMIDEPSP